MSEIRETIDYKNYSIEVHYDEDPSNPRDWDNLGTMVLFWNRYNLGDEKTDPTGEYKMSKEEAQEFCNRKDIISLPIFVYEHSGITIRTSNAGYPFNDRFDAGCGGYIYITKEKIRKEYGWKNITKKRAEQIAKYLEGEVETYDEYLTGQVYGFICKDENGEEIDEGSCWGFLGYDLKESGLLSEAKCTVTADITHKATELGKKKLAEFNKLGIQQKMEI